MVVLLPYLPLSATLRHTTWSSLTHYCCFTSRFASQRHRKHVASFDTPAVERRGRLASFLFFIDSSWSVACFLFSLIHFSSSSSSSSYSSFHFASSTFFCSPSLLECLPLQPQWIFHYDSPPRGSPRSKLPKTEGKPAENRQKTDCYLPAKKKNPTPASGMR